MQTRVAKLYVHGPRGIYPEATEAIPMIPISEVEAVEGMGLRQDARYFRPNPDAHKRKRQVSLIDEGTIWRLEEQFGPIQRDLLKAQIILEGDVFLPAIVDQTLTFPSGAELKVSIAREPCYAMDLVKPGLRLAMQNSQQGALARVTVTGKIAVGDTVLVGEAVEAVAAAT